MEDNWELYYWPLAGRGEFVRIIFVEADVEFKDIDDPDIIRKKVHGGELGGFPIMFPPVLRNGDFHLAQTPVICKYLGKKFGMWPEKDEDVWYADQLNTTIHDFIAEGRLAFHGRNPIESYYTQKEETQPYIDRFVSTRLTKWLLHFEAVLKNNNEGKGFLFGDKLTYVDLALLHALRATASQFSEAWASTDGIPLLRAFKDRLSERPRLKAYFNSKKCRPFEGNSMM